MGFAFRNRLIITICALALASPLFCACAADDDSDNSDDDTSDDDDAGGDDDAGDDDDVFNPYQGMQPDGLTISELLGIASHMSTGPEYDRAREFEIEQAVAAGVQISRRGFYWNNIEPQDDQWNFAGYDAMVDLLHEAGLTPLAMLTHGVNWAMPNGSPSDIDPAVFAEFTGTVANRYADRIDLYEIWNEPNTARFWSPAADPAHYGLLLKAAYASVHEQDPTAQVLFGGLSALDANLLDPRGIWNFIARVGEAHPDLCEHIDGLAIHPYTFAQQPGPEFALDLGFFHYPNLRDSIAEARGLLAELGCGDLPIHLTEIGWPSLLIGMERQAAYLQRGVLLAASVKVQSFCWYTFFDETPDSQIPTEDYFGLYHLPEYEKLTDPPPKEAYHALYGLNQVLGGSRYAGDLAAVLGWDSADYALVFVDDANAWTVALWHFSDKLDNAAQVELPLHPDGQGDWVLFDEHGAVLDSGPVADVPLSLTISGEVRFLRLWVAAD